MKPQRELHIHPYSTAGGIICAVVWTQATRRVGSLCLSESNRHNKEPE